MPIAFDAKSIGSSGTDVTSLTIAHTCTGSNLVLVVVATIQGNAATVTGITYNGVAMTLGKKGGPDADNNQVYLFYLANPATGTNNIVITYSGNASPVFGAGISYTGANVSSPLGAIGSTNDSVQNPSHSLTTSFVNSFIVDGFVRETGTTTAPTASGTGHTLRQEAHDNSSLFSVHAAGDVSTTAATSYTFGWNTDSAHNNVHAYIEIRELSTTAAPALSYSVPSVDFQIKKQVIGY